VNELARTLLKAQQRAKLGHARYLLARLVHLRRAHEEKQKRRMERKLQATSFLTGVLRDVLLRRFKAVVVSEQKKKVNSSLQILNSNSEYQHIKSILDQKTSEKSQKMNSSLNNTQSVLQESVQSPSKQNQTSSFNKKENQLLTRSSMAIIQKYLGDTPSQALPTILESTPFKLDASQVFVNSQENFYKVLTGI